MGESMNPPIPAPPPVTGYRQLTPQDVALMNEAKAAFDVIGNVLAKIRYPNGTPDTVDGLGFPYDAEEALRNARHYAQTASMWAVRAITRPSSFA